MKRIIVILCVVVTITIGCKKDPNSSVVVNTFVDIYYLNSSDQYLLNNSTPNHFDADSFIVYNVTNNVKTVVDYPNLDWPNDFAVLSDSLKNNFLRVVLQTDTTLLTLSKNITDTITCIIYKSEGNTLIKNISYNGVSENQRFTITKNR